MIYRCESQKDWSLRLTSGGVLALIGYTLVDFMNQKVIFGDLILPEDARQVWEAAQEKVRQKRPCIKAAHFPFGCF